MAKPWEKYAKAENPQQSDGPWSKYQKTEQPAPEAESYDRNWYDPIRAGLQGMTLGFSDEIGSAVAAPFAALTAKTDPENVGKMLRGEPFDPNQGPSIGGAYGNIQQSVSGEQAAYREARPLEAGAIEIGSGLLTGGTGIAKTAAKMAGKSIPKQIAANAGVGALEGAIAGAGYSDPGERAEGAAVGAVLGAPLGVVGGEVARGARALKRMSDTRKEISNLLKDGSTDRKVAKYLLDGAKKVQKDRVAEEAVRQGVDEGVVATIKGASDSDRRAMNKMLSVLQRGKENARFGAINRASDVIGDSVTKRVSLISATNRRAGQALKGVAQKLKGQPADFSQPVDDLVQGLDEYGIALNRNSQGVIRPDFSESLFRQNPAAKRLISNLIDEMQKPGGVDGFRAHWLKKMIDDQVTYGKSKTGLGGEAERLVKRFRHNLDAALDNQFPEYKRVNDTYSDTRSVLDAIQDAAGKKIDIEGRNADKALGTLSRSLLSNIRSRANLINSLDDLESAAKRYGGKFDDDILTQVLFADELDRLFGASAKTSLQGDAQKAAERAARSGIKDVAIDLVGKGVNKARGVNEENTIKALRQLLMRQGRKAPTPGTELAIP